MYCLYIHITLYVNSILFFCFSVVGLLHDIRLTAIYFQWPLKHRHCSYSQSVVHENLEIENRIFQGLRRKNV
jgi:regulatory protein YycI of two-component signal transduction system YycFG